MDYGQPAPDGAKIRMVLAADLAVLSRRGLCILAEAPSAVFSVAFQDTQMAADEQAGFT
jgi:hypothetical protein